MTGLWADTGAWIAIGISVLFLVVAWVMHRVIVKVLKNPRSAPDSAAPPRDPS